MLIQTKAFAKLRGDNLPLRVMHFSAYPPSLFCEVHRVSTGNGKLQCYNTSTRLEDDTSTVVVTKQQSIVPLIMIPLTITSFYALRHDPQFPFFFFFTGPPYPPLETRQY